MAPMTLDHTMVAQDLDKTNQLIVRQLRSKIPLIEELGLHITQSGGKRLRPLLVLLGSKLFDYTGEAHITLAAMIELIHTATLLHDDVVDASTLRRGKETANSIWGNQASVLVGDYLYSQAFQMMVSLQNFKIFETLATATKTIAEGEILQLENCHNPDTTEEKYMEVIRCKTGTLFAAAAQMGAILCHREEIESQKMHQYGAHLGTAFQLIDDALDYAADPTLTGKNLGDDLAEGKPTLPLIHALKHGSVQEKNMIRHALSNSDQAHLSEILSAIESTKAIAYTYSAAKIEADKAKAQLAYLPNNEYRQALLSLVDFAVDRRF